MRIIGYAFDADLHCVSCTQKRFIASGKSSNLDYHGIDLNQKDSEGNNVHPIFSTDEIYREYCSDCLGKLD